MTISADRSSLYVTTAILVALSIVFGGGGYPAPAQEIFLEIAALATLAFAAFRHRVILPRDRLVVPILAAVILLPLLQLVPLPPALWQNLPGRQPMVAALTLIERAGEWRSFSLDPYRTLAGLLSIIPPAVAFLLVANLGTRDRSRLLVLIGALGCLATAIGALQLLGADIAALYPYKQQGPGLITGFQANRNHTGTLLLICVFAFAALMAGAERGRGGSMLRYGMGAAIALLCIAAMLTGSRTATASLVLLALAGLVFAVTRRGLSKGSRIAALSLLLAGPALLLGAALFGNAAVWRTLDRFESGGGERVESLWPDTVAASQNLGWIGGGLGTFEQVQHGSGRLEGVTPLNPNRAHNDWLETLLEYGFAGPLLLFAAGAAACWRASATIRSGSPPARKAQAAFAAASILLLLLHSIVDYPLRTIALSVLAAVAAGMLTGPTSSRATTEGSH